MPSGIGLLSLLIWLPIAAGLLVLVLGEGRAAVGRWISLLGSLATFVACIPLFTRFDGTTAAMQFVERLPWITCVSRGLLPRRRRHLDAAHPADDVHDGAGRDRGLDRDREARRAVLRCVPDPGRADDRRVRGARRAAVLRLLGSDADPDVHHHRRLGRTAARLRDHQVLPVHLPRLGVHAGRADLHVPAERELRDRGVPGAAADDDEQVADLLRLPARLRGQGADVCRCTPGCRMRTSRRRPAAR